MGVGQQTHFTDTKRNDGLLELDIESVSVSSCLLSIVALKFGMYPLLAWYSINENFLWKIAWIFGIDSLNP